MTEGLGGGGGVGTAIISATGVSNGVGSSHLYIIPPPQPGRGFTIRTVYVKLEVSRS